MTHEYIMYGCIIASATMEKVFVFMWSWNSSEILSNQDILEKNHGLVALW